MGNISTHRFVGEAAKVDLPPDLPPISQEEFRTYFRIGNWLTDVSQLRDPFANALGKSTAWKKAREESFAKKLPFVMDLIANVDNWLDELTGEPGDSDREALLSTWFGKAVFIYGMETFRDRTEDKKKLDKAKTDPAVAAKLVSDAASSPFDVKKDDAAEMLKIASDLSKPTKDHKVPAAEFKRVFDTFWTQYWPHEHVDFPPWPLGDPLGERDRSDKKKHSCDHADGDHPSDSRRLLKYQEEQILSLAETLTSIEQDWIELGTDYATDDKRKGVHDLLVRLGKASHAVEDFYFHSNFVETAWASLSDAERATSDKAAVGLDNIRAERLLRRRLRAPLAKDGKLSPERSGATELVFTESFGEKDISHTFADSMSDMEAHSDLLRLFGKVFEPLLVVTDKEREKTLLHDDKVEAVTKAHFKRVLDGTYDKRADWLVDHWAVSAESRDALKAANEIDGRLYKKYSIIELGVFGFILKMISGADKDHTESEGISDRLDKQPARSPDQEPTDNGASAENVGTHSLLAKDSIRKEPLRTPTIQVAAFVVRYVVRTMMQAVGLQTSPVAAARSTRESKDSNTLDRVRAVDWLHLLRHFLCHPAEAERLWYKPLLLNISTKIDVGADDVAASNLNVTLLTSSPHNHVLKALDAATVKQRREQKTRKALEKRYLDIAAEAESKWDAMVTRQFIIDSILIGSAVAVGLIAGALARRDGASVGDALAIGAAAMGGALVGGLAGAALGSAIGGPAGAATGAIVGGLIGAGAGALLANKLAR